MIRLEGAWHRMVVRDFFLYKEKETEDMLTLDYILRHANLSAAQYDRIQPAAEAFGNAVHASFSPADEERILKALALMLELHGDQKPRPDSAPYIEHPLAVAA